MRWILCLTGNPALEHYITLRTSERGVFGGAGGGGGGGGAPNLKMPPFLSYSMPCLSADNVGLLKTLGTGDFCPQHSRLVRLLPRLVLEDGWTNSYGVPTASRYKRAPAVNAHSTHESVSLDAFGPNPPSTRQRLSLLPLSPLPQTPRRSPPSSPPIALSLPHRHHRPCPNPCIDRSGQYHDHDFTHSPTDGTTSDV
ncbi:hypothetical protein SprV_0100322600 [Sparganum proliferum]